MRKLLALVMVLAMLFSVPASFASTNGVGLSNGRVVKHNTSVETSMPDQNTYIFCYTVDGETHKTISKKNKSTVTYSYYINNEFKYSEEVSLDSAIAFGEKVQSAIKANNPLSNNEKAYTANFMSTTSSNYTFDGIAYTSAGMKQPYAHPDRNFYGVSPYITWSKDGYSKTHTQVNVYDSNKVTQAPSWGVGGAIGAMIGALLGGGQGGVIGATVGSVFGALLGADAQRLADEEGCIWFVRDKNITSELIGGRVFLKYHYVQLGPLVERNLLIPVDSPM